MNSKLINKYVSGMLNVMSNKKFKVFCLLLSVYGWEYLFQRHSFTNRPSIIITLIAKKSSEFFVILGKQFAYISQFTNKLNFQKYIKPINDMLIALYKLFISPYNFFSGYVDKLREYINKYLVVLGSLILTIIVIIICEYVCRRYKVRLSDRFLNGLWEDKLLVWVWCFFIVFGIY